MIRKCAYLFFLIFIASHVNDAFARGRCAISYLENRSQSSEFDYLSQILPNSLSDSIKSLIDIPVLKPLEIDTVLSQKGKPSLKDRYEDYELAEVARNIGGVDFFIYGYFSAKSDDTIDVVIRIYDVSTKEIFSFSTSGRLETELFSLVDAITSSFSTLVTSDKFYKDTNIPAKANIAFITNIEGENLNLFYEPFLEKGYSVFSIQSNELRSNINDDGLQNHLLYNTVKTTSFEKARSDKLIHFNYSPSGGIRALNETNAAKKYITTYYYNYSKTHIDYLKNLAFSYKSRLDFLFIVIFDKSMKSAWMQCYDLRKFDVELIWLQTGLSGNGKMGTTVGSIADDITERMGNDKKE